MWLLPVSLELWGPGGTLSGSSPRYSAAHGNFQQVISTAGHLDLWRTPIGSLAAQVVPKNADGTPNPSLATHQILFVKSLDTSISRKNPMFCSDIYLWCWKSEPRRTNMVKRQRPHCKSPRTASCKGPCWFGRPWQPSSAHWCIAT